MTATTVDEETPLLPEQQKKKPTPLPWAQFSILLILQLAEPLTSQVIYPFLPQLVRDVGVTHGDETRVGYYVGVMQSVFFATQAMTVLHWSRLSDHIGRKPVIMTGLFGLSLSIRSLNGALNGNIGVLKSMIAEITDSTNLPQAYSYLPIAWSTGGTLGPMIGGFLSRPVDRFPDIFGGSRFLREYPYFLACAVPATFSAFACLVTLLFLRETVATPGSVRRILKNWLSKDNLAIQNVSNGQDNKATATVGIVTSAKKNEPLPLKQLLIPRVLIAALNYACLALVDISARAILPVFYSTPIELGGLGLAPHHIGKILAIYGILNGFVQIFYFAKTHARFGTKNLYIAGIASSLLVFVTFPVINYLARIAGDKDVYVWLAVGFQVIVSIFINFSYGCVFIYITASSPNRASLGTVNGMAQFSVSVVRAIGPAAANSLFSLSIDPNRHYLNGHLVWGPEDEDES
ncbi:uncharacterized protein PHACADRAFT_158787 [Phanerochaete carnosa HHB-10118-sp]|uniref:Major facilitator superfamily (MFS) profile domain-containing protein n=1 Tax=Phanerochaete carnosa (strain HHB-10118-sp) TaxID=650164 RepID=K5W1M3_PHACS|nr:uncharacterized protein PHACADRAFT_158787 [Phanerochaete carnosa HHB-10118-sp]EKM57753.1 hypothetical protein PHACADRAFT_158787 [Phanerochaete carnosa HHB-10118-sp]